MHNKGKLEVVCGPMFSGKSEELIRRVRRATIARQEVRVFKPAIDDRHSVEHVVSHDGKQVAAQPITNVHDILTQARNCTVVGIDEVQFFAADIVGVICELVDQNKRLIVAGLNLDFRALPFGPMPTLLSIADTITKLEAICTTCGHNAYFTQRLVNNKPARFDDPIIQVGAQEAYQARCRSCFQIDKKPNYLQSLL